MAYDVLSERIESVFDREIRRLVNEISWIDARLATLGDGEEDRIEKILLEALRRHLLSDLREMAGFSGDPYLITGEEAPAASLDSGVEVEA